MTIMISFVLIMTDIIIGAVLLPFGWGRGGGVSKRKALKMPIINESMVSL